MNEGSDSWTAPFVLMMMEFSEDEDLAEMGEHRKTFIINTFSRTKKFVPVDYNYFSDSLYDKLNGFNFFQVAPTLTNWDIFLI